MNSTIATGLNMRDLSLCDSLPPRKRAICRGESGIPEGKRDAYLRKWFADSSVERTATATQPQRNLPHPPRIPFARGVGTHLKLLLKEFGVNADLCGEGCGSFAAMMDGWGIEGCRQNREAILERLRQRYKETSWKTALNAAFQSVVTWNVFGIDVLHPIEWLVDEAVRRAEIETNEARQPTLHQPEA